MVDERAKERERKKERSGLKGNEAGRALPSLFASVTLPVLGSTHAIGWLRLLAALSAKRRSSETAKQPSNISSHSTQRSVTCVFALRARQLARSLEATRHGSYVRATPRTFAI